MTTGEWGDATWDFGAPDTSEPTETTTKTPEAPMPEAITGTAADIPELGNATLDQLAKIANMHHATAEAAELTAAQAAWHAGRALLAAKARCIHGTWLAWLHENFNGSARTAQAYMRIATKCAEATHLGDHRSIASALQAMATARREPVEPEPPDDHAMVVSFLRRLDTVRLDSMGIARAARDSGAVKNDEFYREAFETVHETIHRLSQLAEELEKQRAGE